MAKVRNAANTIRQGRIGENTWYVRDGVQVVRQRLQNSNYGEGARRSSAQQERRAKWGNLVNFYKAIKSWQPKAYESLKQGVTDYNAFMQLNANSTPVYLTRQLVEAGAAVADDFKVSKGSLPSVPCVQPSSTFDVAMTVSYTKEYESTPNVGELSTDLIGSSSDFQEGDALGFVSVSCVVGDDSIPRCRSFYTEIVLNKTSTTTLASLGLSASKQSGVHPVEFSFTRAGGSVSLATIIHTRQDANILRVSSQSLVPKSSYNVIDAYITPAAKAAAIASYGVDGDVPLAPGA